MKTELERLLIYDFQLIEPRPQLNITSTKPLLHGNVHNHAAAFFLFPFLSLADTAYEEFRFFKDMYKLPELRIRQPVIMEEPWPGWSCVSARELEKLNQDIEKAEAKLRQAEHKEKILQCQVKKLTRKERTHRLCTRGAMLESYFPNPESVTDEQIGIILNILFHRSGTERIVEQALAEN